MHDKESEELKRVGLIGGGIWGKNILRDLVAMEAVVEVWEPDESQHTALQEMGAANVWRGLPTADNALDGIIVASPSTTHRAVLEQIMPLNLPIFVEKPLTTNLEDAEALAETVHDRVFLMHIWRYHPGVLQLGELARTQVLAEVVKQSVYPAYQSLRDFLNNEYLPGLRKGIGISGITDGKAYYRQRVKYFTTDDISPEEVFATGQREVARIRAEMEAIVKRTGFSGSFADFLDFLRTDEQFYAKTPEELLSRAAWITKRMEGKLPQYFNQLPRMPLTVSPVPDALAPNYTGGRYSPGSYQRRKAGAFWVNTYDLPSRPFYVLPALALHEGVPGHHTQMMLAAEMEGLPAFRNNLYLSAFGEGWALYCEYLGKEAGIYQTDYEEFGRLVYEMWRACRLVVDPGMHYMGWTRQQAVDFMASNTALSLHEVNTEIDRYIGWPGQAVSYKMGELKIRELRKYAEAELGDRFDIAAFHDLVLANGAITMRGLEGVIYVWVESYSN